MDSTSLAILLSAGMRMYADFADRVAAGTVTQDDITKMLAALGHTLDTWQAKIDAHKAANP